MDDELAQVPEEFRAACGRPGSRVIVRHFPVTIPHALCDLTGVAIAYPRHGGATVHATPGSDRQQPRIPADRPSRDPGRHRGRPAPARRAAPVACWPGQRVSVWRKSRSLAAIQVPAR